MFKKYQKLLIRKFYTDEIIEVYYLADYIGTTFKSSSYTQETILLCQTYDLEILHLPASHIVNILTNVE
jgi:hypothetical protein